MTQAIHYRHITDTRTALSATLKQRNPSRVLTVVDLTPCTVAFKMVDADGVVVIEETSDGVTIDSPTGGQVSYDFSSAGVLTAGTYYGYFIVYDGSLGTDHFPSRHQELKIVLSAD